jgi:hypothetical protein
LDNFKINWNTKNIKNIAPYVWVQKPFFSVSFSPSILKNSRFIKLIENSAFDLLKVILSKLNKKQSVQLISSVFYEILDDNSLENTEKQQLISKKATLISNEVFITSMNQVKLVMDKQKSLTVKTNDFLKQVQEYGILSQYNTKDKVVKKRPLL